MKQQEQIKTELCEILKWEPSSSKLIDGRIMADYYRHDAKPTEFIGDTEDEAFEKLLTYLKAQPQPKN